MYFALLIIILTLSPLLHYSDQQYNTINHSLDSDFLETDKLEENINSSYFWRMHRIFSISLGFACLLSGLIALYKPSTPTYVAFVVFFGLSILLWHYAKLGSFVASTFCLLVMFLVVFFLILTKDVEEVKQVHTAFTSTILILFFTSFMGSTPFILLNKEVRKEWKMEK